MKQLSIRIGLIVSIAIFIASGWYLLAPHFLNRSADVTSRFIFPAKEDVGMIMPPQTIASAVAARLVEQPLGADDATTTAAAIISAVSETPPATAPVTATILTTTTVSPTEAPTATPITPTILLQGHFVDGDVFHKGSGTATIWRIAADSYVLRLTDFSTSVGPDLRLLLSPNAAPASHARLGAYLEVSKLKGNIGDQEYALPVGFDPTQYQSVVIYCAPFRVIFATATLE